MKIKPDIIRIDVETADLLAKLRMPGESWSDLVKRCARTELEAQQSMNPIHPCKESK